MKNLVNELVQIYESRKEFDQAFTYLQRVIQLQPNNGLARVRLAKVLMAKKNIEGAITAYEKAIAIQPEQPEWVFNGLESVFELLGKATG